MDLLQLTAEAKERLTIPDVWARLGLPGEARAHGVVKSPFRDDRKGASFSIFKAGRMFKDHAEGDQAQGDVINFIELATGCDRAQAMRTLIELAGMGHQLERGSGQKSVASGPPVKLEPRPAQPERGTGWGFRRLPKLPETLPATAERVESLAKQRGLEPWAILAAVERGLLAFVRHWDREGWMVRDGTACNAQVRRLDGGLWQINGTGMKGLTLPDSWASWPLGVTDPAPQSSTLNPQSSIPPGILLVEGAPDLLAAVQWLEEQGKTEVFAPVAMLGTGHPIQGSALVHFLGRHVIIVEQNDPPKTRPNGTTYHPGQDAAAKWQQQLTGTAASVTILHLPAEMPGKDLNDYLKWNQRKPLLA